MEREWTRRPCPSDVSDDEWAFVAPYLTLMTEDAPQRVASLCELFDAAPLGGRAHTGLGSALSAAGAR